MTPIVGDRGRVALEFELERPVDPDWCFGQFRMWIGGAAVGNWDDVVPLRSIAAWWRSFSAVEQIRWDPMLEGLDRQRWFDLSGRNGATLRCSG